MVSAFDIRCTNCGHRFNQGVNPYNLTVTCPVCEWAIGEIEVTIRYYATPIRREG